jgi:hypothetical protein
LIGERQERVLATIAAARAPELEEAFAGRHAKR